MRRMVLAMVGVVLIQGVLLGAIHLALSPAIWRDVEGPGFRCSLPWPASTGRWTEGAWSGVSVLTE